MNPTGTQSDAILAALTERHGQWVPMPELASRSGAFAVHSRIADLRAAGYRIDNRTEGQRPKKSFYRLASPVQTNLPL